MIKKLLGSWHWEIAGIACILLLILLAFASCNAQRELKSERDLAEGRTISAVEAIKKIEDLKGRGTEEDRKIQEAIDEVRKADPKDRDAIARARLRELQQPS